MTDGRQRKSLEPLWARAAELYDRWLAGETYSAMGRELGYDRELIRQAVGKGAMQRDEWPPSRPAPDKP